MKIGKMDGFCVGEPWGARHRGQNWFHQRHHAGHLEGSSRKVCAFTAEFADKNPKTVKAVLKALHEASVWLDDMNNRPEQCEIVSKADLHQLRQGKSFSAACSANWIMVMAARLRTNFRCTSASGTAITRNPPTRSGGSPQFRRWGMVSGAPDYEGVASKVMRGDIYTEAMKEIGVTDRTQDDSGWEMFDGVKFDPKGDLEAYAKAFAVNSLKG